MNGMEYRRGCYIGVFRRVVEITTSAFVFAAMGMWRDWQWQCGGKGTHTSQLPYLASSTSAVNTNRAPLRDGLTALAQKTFSDTKHTLLLGS